MSGIVATLLLSAPAETAAQVAAIVDRLRHRGPDGVDAVTGPGYSLTHLHFLTTPEEAGERQPVTDPNTGTHLALDGRIDNRRDLESALGGDAPEISDARLLLRAYARWGRACFERVIGPFAVAIRDGRSGEFLAARDPMGDRSLYYSLVPGGVAIASEEHALLAHPGVGSELDEETLARYFAIEAPREGATFFRAIRETPAGSVLVASDRQVRVEPFWKPRSPAPIRYRRDEEYAEHFASVFGDAVEARLRSSSPVGVSLSGGMDSPSVAALAVERLKQSGSGKRLASFSWVFDDLPECDERRWIEPLVSALDLDATYLVADPYWPLRDLGTWPVNPNTPISNIYRTLKQALYTAAGSRGVRTLLAGVFSDSLFVGREAWLASRVTGGHWPDLFRHLARLATDRKRWRVWRDPACRALLRPFVPPRMRRALRPQKPAWLTPAAWKLIEAGQPDPVTDCDDVQARRVASVFDDLNRMWAGEAYFTSRIPLEIRDPFRDLRVVDFMLAVPPDQLERGPTQKYVLRRAMKGRIPDVIIERTQRTPLDPVYRKRLLGGEAATMSALLRSPDALWRGRVEEEWLLGGFPEKFRGMPDGRALVVPYFAAAAVLWSRASGLPRP